METQQTKMSEPTWDEAQSASFVQFEDGKRFVYAVTNWKLARVQKPDYNDKTKLVDMIEFQADVIGMSNEVKKDVVIECKPVKMKIGSTSKRLMAGMRPCLEKRKSDEVVFLSIKRIGKDNATNFDVEESDLKTLV
jgi:hypothetical protein